MQSCQREQIEMKIWQNHGYIILMVPVFGEHRRAYLEYHGQGPGVAYYLLQVTAALSHFKLK